MNLKSIIFCLSMGLTSLLHASDKPLKIGMVTDVGGVNDQSFNQSAWEGLQKAKKELGIKDFRNSSAIINFDDLQSQPLIERFDEYRKALRAFFGADDDRSLLD